MYNIFLYMIHTYIKIIHFIGYYFLKQLKIYNFLKDKSLYKYTKKRIMKIEGKIREYLWREEE